MMNMNTTTNKIRVSVIGTVVLCTVFIVPVAMGGDLIIPKSWMNGETLTDVDLNGNFQAVEAEVDDNAADIANNTANKLNVSGGTLTGGLTVPFISFSAPLSYTKALGMNDFGCYSNGSSTYDCGRVIIAAGRIAYAALSVGSTVILTARLHIPDGARLTEVTCHFVDNSVSYNSSFRVLNRRFNSTGPGWLVLTNSISTTAASTSIQSLNATSDPVIGNWGASGPIVNNANDVLFVEVTLFDTDGSGVIGDMFLNGCSYQYEVSNL